MECSLWFYFLDSEFRAAFSERQMQWGNSRTIRNFFVVYFSQFLLQEFWFNENLIAIWEIYQFDVLVQNFNLYVSIMKDFPRNFLFLRKEKANKTPIFYEWNTFFMTEVRRLDNTLEEMDDVLSSF